MGKALSWLMIVGKPLVIPTALVASLPFSYWCPSPCHISPVDTMLGSMGFRVTSSPFSPLPRST